ncbi:RNase H domain-containing protein [Aphis craccivora]|uniref:RNase H domain-containing protein n=1 Tax=Aphis craccivora TaxID=307492 RepID=A0A6G0ZLD2_APHCR|nr:RNase H domain-containing protein [Aphis craccivora]
MLMIFSGLPSYYVLPAVSVDDLPADECADVKPAGKIQNTHYIAKQQDKNITYSWIPGHCNINGNELADTAAKLAHSSPNSITLPIFSLNGIKSVIENNTLLQCQKEWNEMSTKLNEIKRSTLSYPSPDNILRKHETSINRLRIGHTHLTHSHLMKKEDPPPVCTCCGTLLTVKHILTEYRIYDKERRLYQISNLLDEALNPDPNNIHKIIQFLKQTNIINKL